MNAVQHFAFGAIAGVPFTLFLAKRHGLKEYAPLAIALCGIWAAIPYVLLVILGLSERVVNSLFFNIFFFFPLLNKINLPDFELMVTFAIVWIIYIFICYYYISYAKKLIHYKERLEKDA